MQKISKEEIKNYLAIKARSHRVNSLTQASSEVDGLLLPVGRQRLLKRQTKNNAQLQFRGI